MRTTKTTKDYYLTSDQIYTEWKKWKESGIISEDMGKMILNFCNHIIEHHHFSNYHKCLKDEMVSDMCLKIMKNLKNMKEEFHGSFFSYWSRCAFQAGYDYLMKHYTRINRKRKLMVAALEYAQTRCPNTMREQEIRILKDEIARYDGSLSDTEENEQI